MSRVLGHTLSSGTMFAGEKHCDMAKSGKTDDSRVECICVLEAEGKTLRYREWERIAKDGWSFGVRADRQGSC